MDFSVFDSLLDSVFVINENREIVYCNESAATVTGSSVRRLTKNKIINKFITFSNDKLFTMPNGTWGKTETTNFTEVDFFSKTKSGKIQINIQPTNNNLWVVVLHDVTLEETLHSKYHLQLSEKEDVINQLEVAHKKLEDYSKNLETMVEERTEALNKANLSLKAIMNSLGQGFLIFDENGMCGDIYTKACESILEEMPANKNIINVLSLKDSERSQVEMWIQAIFSESLPFESLKELGPEVYNHTQNKHITLDFYPIRNTDDKIINVVLVATDKTSERQAQIAMEKEKQYSNMILKLIKNKKQFKEFLDQCVVRIQDAISSSQNDYKYLDIESSFRILHTIEGEAGIFGAEEIRVASRESQKALGLVEKCIDTETEQSNYSDFKNTLKTLDNVYHEFLSKNNEAFNIIGLNKTEQVLEIKKKDITSFLHLLEKNNVSDHIKFQYEEVFLKEGLQDLLQLYNELILSISEKQGKLVSPILFTGENIRVDSKEFEPITSSLVHAFRNIIDHGLELPHIRKDLKKDEYGQIEIVFSKSEHDIIIIIQDDGAGISTDKIKEKLLENFPEDIQQINAASNYWLLQQIFRPGFSSRAEISEFSGRGVGMDAIKSAVNELGGQVSVSSKKGQGTQLHISVPLKTNLRSLAKSA